MAADEAALLAFLDRLGITSRTHRHQALHTVAESKRLRGDLPGGHAKTLLIKDKRGAMALLVVEEDRRVDLKWVSDRLGLGRLSFASPERLRETLGVEPGAVTPFALVNRRHPPQDAPPLSVAVDRALMDHDEVNFHPLHNRATTTISSGNLLRFIEACGYRPLVLDIAGEDD